MAQDFMKELTAFCREKGFIWGPSPEIYGGLSGFYTYGPLGKLLKNNVEDQIRKVFQQNNFWEVECPTIQPAAVWEASGHLGGFTDPLIKDVEGNVYRADHLVEEALEQAGKDPAVELAGKGDQLLSFIKDLQIKAPNGKELVSEITNHNLMMQTTIGLDIEAYNRPETATTTYLPFQNYFNYFRKQIPFGVFQIGKAYRNEISPRQFTMRMREFTQAEAQLFIFEDQKNSYEGFDRMKDHALPLFAWEHQEKDKSLEIMNVQEARSKGFFKNDAYAFTVAMAYELFKSIGVPEESMRLRQHGPDEKAFYADDAWDIEVKTKSFGWQEMCGVHDRTNYDLKQHQEHSNKKLVVSDETHKKELPHILEIAFGTDRAAFVLLDLLFNPQDIKEGKTTFHIPKHIAPIKAAIFPLVKKEGMPEIAREIYEKLSQEMVCIYDESGSVGRRYLRAAEQGIPYSITIDGETLEDNTVTLRDRDTEKQIRVKREELSTHIRKLINS